MSKLVRSYSNVTVRPSTILVITYDCDERPPLGQSTDLSLVLMVEVRLNLNISRESNMTMLN